VFGVLFIWGWNFITIF